MLASRLAHRAGTVQAREFVICRLPLVIDLRLITGSALRLQRREKILRAAERRSDSRLGTGNLIRRDGTLNIRGFWAVESRATSAAG